RKDPKRRGMGDPRTHASLARVGGGGKTFPGTGICVVPPDRKGPVLEPGPVLLLHRDRQGDVGVECCTGRLDIVRFTGEYIPGGRWGYLGRGTAGEIDL